MSNLNLGKTGGLPVAVLNNSSSQTEGNDATSAFRCLLCDQQVAIGDIAEHKRGHTDVVGYGILWPPRTEVRPRAIHVPTYEAPNIANILGVSRVFIRDEGENPSGSMKDYSVERAVDLGTATGKRTFSVVSSGNHAYSLCRRVQDVGARGIVFTPASSSKIPLLATFPNVTVVAMRDAIFEDVYNLVTKAESCQLDGMYNANVDNEELLPGFSVIADDILSLPAVPTHILAGVGNGSYLAGIALGLSWCTDTIPIKIVPVGMKGAFPTEDAFSQDVPWHKYREFHTQESEIDAAEGSIAVESYSMPQLMHGLRLTHGFPLGGLTNKDLCAAYLVLVREKSLVKNGAIPEPTGIMSLAAALKWRQRFLPSDVLLLSFTGNGAKDQHGILRLASAVSGKLVGSVKRHRPDLIANPGGSRRGTVLFIEKNTTSEALRALIL